MSVKLYVGNLPWGTQTEDLRELFSQYGEVQDTFIPLDRESGRPRGFAFVTMAEGSDAAINALNETEFQGRTIRVNEAQPPGERRGGFNNRGNGGGFGGGGFQQRGGFGGGGYGGGYNQGGYGGGGYGGQRQGYGNQGGYGGQGYGY